MQSLKKLLCSVNEVHNLKGKFLNGKKMCSSNKIRLWSAFLTPHSCVIKGLEEKMQLSHTERGSVFMITAPFNNICVQCAYDRNVIFYVNWQSIRKNQHLHLIPHGAFATTTIKLSCDTHFQGAFTSCVCDFKVFTLV